MRAGMTHRGPDGSGQHDLQAGDLSLWLGHQRLAIIDLTDSGAQPMQAADGSRLAFNGEVYNFRQLQQEHGAAPQSNSDAAVLLDLLTRRGMQALPLVRGMFAFAYWSAREQALYLVRDRFGIKPLYWCRPSSSLLAFASEPRALAAAGFGGPVRRDRLATFLRRGHIPNDESSIEGLDVVPPASWLRFDGRTLGITQWFDIADIAGSGRISTADAGAALQAALDDSVRAHLVSDVPVGLFLSGGLDSAALVASAARVGGSRLRTFTVSVPGSSIDEAEPASGIARAFGTDHTEVRVAREEIGSWIEEGLEIMTEPTYDGLNMFIVSRAVARAGLKVALTGLGGDEVLGGYPSFRDVPRLWKAMAPFRAGLPGKAIASHLARLVPVAAPGKLAEIVREPARTRAGLWRQYRSLFERREILRLTGEPAPPDDQATDVARRPTLDVIMLCELTEFMTSQLLRDADAFSMCDGLELRVPFVDHLLMARVHQRGWWSRGSHGTHKAAIFAAMPDPLPAAHLARRKTGFIIPMREWLNAALAGDRSLAVLQGALQSAAVRPYVDAFARGRLDANRLWTLVVYEHFQRKYAAA